MNKNEIIEVLEEIATLLEFKGENPFKVQAYRQAARQLESAGANFIAMVETGTLTDLPKIGKDLAEKITILYREGEHPLHKQLKMETPPGLLEMLKIPGLGAKKIKFLYEKLGIKTIAELKDACEKESLRTLPGFGLKSEENILSGISHLEEYSRRHLWWTAKEIAGPVFQGLSELKDVEAVEICGSFRRKLETVGDLDFLASSSNPQPVMEWFTSQPWVESVTAKGSTKSSIRLKGGMQADLRVVPRDQYPFALIYFSGSKEHNIALRQRARNKGLSLNEYGFFPIDDQTPLPRLKEKRLTEEDIYKMLDLVFIPPELREDRGEFDAAELGQLPQLIQEEDIRGAFHNHTTESDGRNTLEEMAEAAERLGWDYLGIADHSKSSFQANGLDEERLFAQLEKIRKLNRSKKFRTHLFAGVECDILKDGKLDLSDDILAALDYVIVSIHQGFKQDEKTTTNRLIKAIEHPLSTMVGHLSGRLLLKREPYPLDIFKVIDAAIANNKIIEINAHPMRLDMDWRHWHKAKEKGLMCAINTDAHTTEGLILFSAGVNIARKGWLEKKDVLNTYPLAKVKSYLAASRKP